MKKFFNMSLFRNIQSRNKLDNKQKMYGVCKAERGEIGASNYQKR